jgi:hypothetical protein
VAQFERPLPKKIDLVRNLAGIVCMKKLLLFTIVMLVSITQLPAGDGKFVSRLIHEGDEPVNIHLNGTKYIKVIDFRQSDVVQISPGVFTVGGIYAYQGLTGTPGMLVASAGALEKELVLAGPIVMYVPPLAGTTLFLSYFIGNN